MSFGEGLSKFVFTPMAYAVSGPIDGLFRGLARHNTPIDYSRMIETYPRLDGYTPINSYMEHPWKRGDEPFAYYINYESPNKKMDLPASLGVFFAQSFGTITATPVWIPVRLTRELYEFRAGN